MHCTSRGQRESVTRSNSIRSDADHTVTGLLRVTLIVSVTIVACAVNVVTCEKQTIVASPSVPIARLELTA